MKFVGKYELLDQVSSGTVEAFTARDSVSGELGVVYLFPASDRPENLSGIQWALQCFLGVAPLPAAAVVDGGQELRRGYLVSKFDETALQRWVSAYKLRSEAAQPADTVLPELEVVELSAPSPEGPAENALASGARRPREFTEEFLRTAYPQENPRAKWSSATGPRPLPSAGAVDNDLPQPGSFTSEFGAGLQSSPTAGKKAFRPETNQRIFAEEMKAEGFPAKSGTGEFTKFFRGPFGLSASAPPSSVAPPENPDSDGDSEGKFTGVFGSASTGSAPVPQQPATPFLGPTQPPIGEFTRLFGSQESEAPAAVEAIRGPDSALGVSAQPAALSNAGVESPNGIVSNNPPEEPARMARITSHGAEQSDSGKQAATRLFKSEQGRLTGNSLPLPSGPSEYTRVIQAPKPSEPFAMPSPNMVVPAAPAPVTPAPSPPPAMAVGAWPPVPVPAAPVPVPVPVTPPVSPVQFQPPMIYPPQPPAQVIPMPSPPAMSLPQPAPPLQPSPAPGPARISYWPLIIGLNVLFIIAVLLVLYFALKH